MVDIFRVHNNIDEQLKLFKEREKQSDLQIPVQVKDGLVVNQKLIMPINEFQNSEKVINAVQKINLKPEWEFPSFEPKGNNVLLLIPTNNKFKVNTLTSVAEETLKEESNKNAELLDANLIIISKPANSDVNEQPYNCAGFRGALNRAGHVMDWLKSQEAEKLIEDEKIGFVLVGSIENYIKLPSKEGGIERPTDFGAVIFCNILRKECTASLSKGVTVSAEYVKEAMRYGFDADNKVYGKEIESIPDKNYDINGGNVTVGNIIKTHIEGVSNDDWHKTAAGVSRYELLKEAAEKLELQIY